MLYVGMLYVVYMYVVGCMCHICGMVHVLYFISCGIFYAAYGKRCKVCVGVLVRLCKSV